MKKLLAVIMVAVLLCGCVACGQTTRPDDNSTPVSDVSTTTTAEDVTTTTTAGDDTTAGDVSVDDTTTEDVSAADTTTGDSPAASTTTQKPTEGATTKKPTEGTASQNAASTTTTTKKPTEGTTTTTKTTKSVGGLFGSTTTVSTKPVLTTTTTTKRPTKTTVAPWDPTQKSVRILAVGNSFSVDAMKKHLWDMLYSAGYEEITLGILYIGGCTLKTHWQNALNEQPSYTYYYTTTGTWKEENSVNILRGVMDGTWDIITVQQASNDSGMPDTYSYLPDLVNWIRGKQPSARIYFHMTWAYQQNSTHSAFPKYDSDQLTMYNAIVSTVQSKVVGVDGIAGVIPSGTAIQNLRTSSLGDTLTSDGYHLKDTYGDYTAAMTWYCCLFNGSPEDVSYRPSSINSYFDAIAQSVTNAIKAPYRITSCK